ncbi:MAG: phosphoglucosamine mutase, partial [Endomicrobia bacterium]|nr:phosphoglucosamine mutase [Endomicrobiia bacterium]
TGDGLLSAVRLLAALNRENKTMSQFLTGVEKFPQILVNRKVAQKIPLEKLPESVALIGNYEKELGAEGRILVRYSGTENLLRVMVEGKDAQRIKAIADEITDSITAEVEKLGS